MLGSLYRQDPQERLLRDVTFFLKTEGKVLLYTHVTNRSKTLAGAYMKRKTIVLTGVARWTGRCPAN